MFNTQLLHYCLCMAVILLNLPFDVLSLFTISGLFNGRCKAITSLLTSDVKPAISVMPASLAVVTMPVGIFSSNCRELVTMTSI